MSRRPPGPPLFPYTTLFRSGLAGLEVDFARELTGALGRSLELRELEWNELIPALEAGRIDLIMSGMTITRARQDRKSTRLNSSHTVISYAVFCLKKKKTILQ